MYEYERSVEALRPIVDVEAAADAVGVGTATIRSWAHRGYLQSVGKDRRRTLYRLADVYRVDREREAAREAMTARLAGPAERRHARAAMG